MVGNSHTQAFPSVKLKAQDRNAKTALHFHETECIYVCVIFSMFCFNCYM